MLNRMLQQILPPPLMQLLQVVRGQVRNQPLNDPEFRTLWYSIYALRIPVETVQMLLDGKPRPPEWDYRRFTIPKADGAARVIEEPGPALKEAQTAINNKLLARAMPHASVMSYRTGHSVADHAWAHAGAELIITADIQDFFPSTRADRVESFWFDMYRRQPTAEFMTMLTTHRGGLPQGAPTSPVLSNLVNMQLDKKLAQRAQMAGGRYTRYADDIAFSFRRSRSRLPSDFEQGVRAIIRQHGYQLHPRKGWCVYHRKDEPTVTGLKLTKEGGVRVSDVVRESIAELRKSTDPQDEMRLAGYEGFLQMVEG